MSKTIDHLLGTSYYQEISSYLLAGGNKDTIFTYRKGPFNKDCTFFYYDPKVLLKTATTAANCNSSQKFKLFHPTLFYEACCTCAVYAIHPQDMTKMGLGLCSFPVTIFNHSVEGGFEKIYFCLYDYSQKTDWLEWSVDEYTHLVINSKFYESWGCGKTKGAAFTDYLNTKRSWEWLL